MSIYFCSGKIFCWFHFSSILPVSPQINTNFETFLNARIHLDYELLISIRFVEKEFTSWTKSTLKICDCRWASYGGLLIGSFNLHKPPKRSKLIKNDAKSTLRIDDYHYDKYYHNYYNYYIRRKPLIYTSLMSASTSPFRTFGSSDIFLSLT